jgi:hypothetical protein
MFQPDIGASVRLDADSITSDDDSDETSTGNVIIHHSTNIPPTHPHLQTIPEPMNLMMDDDDSISVVSSDIEWDHFTLNTFPLTIHQDNDDDDNESLYSLQSYPLVMVTYDDDNDDVSLLSMQEI